MKRMMLQLHDYAFIPDLSPEREDERIREFLDQSPPGGVAAEQWSPIPAPTFDDTPLDI